MEVQGKAAPCQDRYNKAVLLERLCEAPVPRKERHDVNGTPSSVTLVASMGTVLSLGLVQAPMVVCLAGSQVPIIIPRSRV